jgi:hypothetical protein
MAIDLRRIGTKILDHLYKSEAREPSSKGQNSIREGACQVEAVVVAEAHTHSSLRTTSTMAVTPTTAQKTIPYSSSLKERWSKNPTSLCSNLRPEK